MHGKKFNKLKSSLSTYKHSEKWKSFFPPSHIQLKQKKHLLLDTPLQKASLCNEGVGGGGMELLYLLMNCYSLYQQKLYSAEFVSTQLKYSPSET